MKLSIPRVKFPKRAAALLLYTVLLFGLFSCGDSGETKRFSDGRKIVAEAYRELSPDSPIVRAGYTLEVAIEAATQIVLCRVEEMTEVSFYVRNGWNFKYEVVIMDVYLDVHDKIGIGKRLTLNAGAGMVKANEAVEQYERVTASLEEPAPVSGKYRDNEYLAGGIQGVIPVEVGKTYLMFLNDEWDTFSDISYYQMHEIDGGRVYTGSDMHVLPQTADEFLQEIKTLISGRTGRADEIGYIEYLEELAAKREQAAESE